MAKEITILPEEEKSRAKETGIRRLKMAVWYDENTPFDSAFGEKLVTLLEAIGCNIQGKNGRKRSPDGFYGGEDIRLMSEQMFFEADVVHVITSSEALSRQNHQYMLGLRGAHDANEAKLEGNIHIVPIKIDDVNLPAWLNKIHPLNLSSEDPSGLGQKLMQTWAAAASEHGY